MNIRHMMLWNVAGEAAGAAGGGASNGASAASAAAANASNGAANASDAGAGQANGTTPPARGLQAFKDAKTDATAAGGEQQQVRGMGDNGGPAWAPEDLPAEMRADTAEATLKKVWDGRPKPPAKAEDYAFEPAPDFIKKHGDLKGDKVLDIARKTLHAAGLDNKQFNTVVQSFYAALDDAGMMAPPIDGEAELAKLMPKTGDPQDRRNQAIKRVTSIFGEINGLVARKELTKEEGNVLHALVVAGEGVSALEKLLKRGGEQGLAAGGQGAPDYSWEQADRDMADPRYSSFNNPKFDRNFRTSVDAKMRTLGPKQARRA